MIINSLHHRILNCKECVASLPFSPRPILQFSAKAKLVIIGQAPGIKAHESMTPWNDASGERLRNWLKISEEQFYDESLIALVPMGFCYPGKGKSGDLPPRKECAEKWHQIIFNDFEAPRLKILVGSYAQNYYLDDKLTLTQRCKAWESYLPHYLVLPHPSPRNNIWLKKNLWFETEVLPNYLSAIKKALTD